MLSTIGFVIFMVTRERLFFIGLRQAFFLSTLQAQRLTSRTVLFQGIPKDQLHLNNLREIFGSDVQKIWMVPDCKDLEKIVKNRDKAWKKLETSQVKLITQTNGKRLKAEKKGQGEKQQSTDLSQFMDPKSRPKHRTKPIIGKKVDTIDFSREELNRLGQEMDREQAKRRDNNVSLQTAAFVEFSTQYAAQNAYQHANHEKKMQYHPRYVGVQPDEVIWKNLGMSPASRKMKMTICTIIISVMIIFWAIPVAFVGILSNINYLTSKVPFLSFINDVPTVILGVITGLLPTILLAVLMALVPIICRCKHPPIFVIGARLIHTEQYWQRLGVNLLCPLSN